VKALIFGAGAHGRVVLDILRAQARHESIEFVDDNELLRGHSINGVVVAGGLDYVLQHDSRTFELIIALGNPKTRLAIARKVKQHSIVFLNAVHPSAVVMQTARLGDGNMVCAAAVINSNAKIGDNVIINTGAIIEHDCALADLVTVSPGVQLGGRVTVEHAAFIGTGAIVLPRVSIGSGAVIGAGAVVTKDIPAGVLVHGVPARVVEQITEAFDWNRLL
jgi:sugar O-acyltransferase (sialic acid O-acetyltransferase NeuD family)